MKITQLGTLGRRSIVVGGGALALTGCFGGFGATTSLWKWNDDFGNKWVKWLVFLGLNILPVYGLFVLADVLVLNSLEFWTGSNPVASNGRTVTRVATADPNTMRVEVRKDDGQLEYAALFRRRSEGHLEVLDTSGKLLTSVRELSDGSVALFDGDGNPLARLTAEDYARAMERVRHGEAAHVAVQAELGDQASQIARVRNDWAPSSLL